VRSKCGGCSPSPTPPSSPLRAPRPSCALTPASARNLDFQPALCSISTDRLIFVLLLNYPHGVHVICIHFAHPSRRFPKRGAPSHHRLAHTMMLDAYSTNAISPCLHPLYVSSRCTQHAKTSASSDCVRTTSLSVSTRRGIARLQLSQHDGGVSKPRKIPTYLKTERSGCARLLCVCRMVVNVLSSRTTLLYYALWRNATLCTGEALGAFHHAMEMRISISLTFDCHDAGRKRLKNILKDRHLGRGHKGSFLTPSLLVTW
jgi:hypothetical protein